MIYKRKLEHHRDQGRGNTVSRHVGHQNSESTFAEVQYVVDVAAQVLDRFVMAHDLQTMQLQYTIGQQILLYDPREGELP